MTTTMRAPTGPEDWCWSDSWGWESAGLESVQPAEGRTRSQARMRYARDVCEPYMDVVAWKRYVSLGSVLTAVTFPLWVYAAHRLGLGDFGGGWLLLASGAIALLVTFKHASNLRRLLAGREFRLGSRSAGDSNTEAR